MLLIVTSDVINGWSVPDVSSFITRCRAGDELQRDAFAWNVAGIFHAYDRVQISLFRSLWVGAMMLLRLTLYVSSILDSM